MSNDFNRGRFSIEEMDIIRRMFEGGCLVSEISKKINREPASVDAWIVKNIGRTDEQKEDVEIENELRDTPYYRELKKQFTNEDIEIFEMHWKELWKQFKNDVFHTESIQIMDLCKIEVLMNKIRRDIYQSGERVRELEIELERAKRSEDEGRENLIMDLHRAIDQNLSSKNVMERDYKDYLKEKGGILKTLKGTRDQRIKEIETAEETLPGLFKKIMNDPVFREEMSKYWEKGRLAAINKREELLKPYEYKEGHVDHPILTPEYIDKEEEERRNIMRGDDE